jgi:hypothetical protein
MSDWKQFRIDSLDIVPKSSDDCFIPQDDPMWDYVGTNKIARAEPQVMFNYDNSGNEKARRMREDGIQPGTKEWFKLWFSKPQK